MVEMSIYRRQIQEELARRTERNPRYSLRAFSKALGFEATVISQILNGKRVPSLRTAQKLIAGLNLSPEAEEQFLTSLAETHQDRGMKRLSPFFKKGAERRPARELSLDLFRVIADWHHYAILALTHTEGFQSNPQWIATELKLTVTQVNLALNRLLELGFLERDTKGNLQRSTEPFTTADKGITDSALKRHQQQILEKAIDSLQNDPIETRSNTSLTFAINPENLPEARKRIEDFTRELSDLLGTGCKKQVYELGIALYPLQTKR